MNHVFIVRPFGIKNGIDFNRVEAELIQPAIQAVGWVGGTTGEIIQQGNIRTDMFQKLLVADLVIADVSIHNANAFYELGVRHAFREKRTFLIRCSKDGLPADAKLDEIPFDLKTDRYLEYRLDDLAGAATKLIAALKATIAAEDRDSPIFQLLPKLTESDPEVFLSVPLGFREEVERAVVAERAGDLGQFVCRRIRPRCRTSVGNALLRSCQQTAVARALGRKRAPRLAPLATVVRHLEAQQPVDVAQRDRARGSERHPACAVGRSRR